MAVDYSANPEKKSRIGWLLFFLIPLLLFSDTTGTATGVIPVAAFKPVIILFIYIRVYFI